MNGLEKEHGHTHVGLYVQAMAKWLAVALVTGVCCGVVGSLFHIGVERATELREQHPWLLWCLPGEGDERWRCPHAPADIRCPKARQLASHSLRGRISPRRRTAR